ncbi:MAG: hypothetical protein ACK559_31410, partial [bacterium]
GDDAQEALEGVAVAGAGVVAVVQPLEVGLVEGRAALVQLGDAPLEGRAPLHAGRRARRGALPPQLALLDEGEALGVGLDLALEVVQLLEQGGGAQPRGDGGHAARAGVGQQQRGQLVV